MNLGFLLAIAAGFVWSLIIFRFKPSLFIEEMNGGVILQKIVSIALIIVGIYLIV